MQDNKLAMALYFSRFCYLLCLSSTKSLNYRQRGNNLLFIYLIFISALLFPYAFPEGIQYVNSTECVTAQMHKYIQKHHLPLNSKQEPRNQQLLLDSRGLNPPKSNPSYFHFFRFLYTKYKS